MKSKIFIAVDTTSISKVKKIISKTQNSKIKVGYKFGLEFLNSKGGRPFLSKLKNKTIFADLKLHDIPNTCVSTVKAIKDLKINYLTASPENLKIDRKFDVILNMEIIEHVEDVDIFLKSCSSLLKKEGIMFVATINKTLKSYLFAIIGAEYILRWLPIGTHEWDKFIDPNDLIKISKKYNLQLQNLDGMKFNIITDKWSISSDKSINYIGKFNKV